MTTAPSFISIETGPATCPLCGGNDSILYMKVPVRSDQLGKFPLDVWDLLRCKSCGMIYIHPTPDLQTLNTMYSFQNSVDRAFVQDWFIDGAFLHKEHWRRMLDVIAHYVPTGRLLDIGCGAGTFLTIARERGYQVMGQEVTPFFIDFCRNQHGLDILAGEVKDLGLPSESFDVITLFDVIEHVLEPNELIEQSFHLLKPGGILMVGTHDIGNWMARCYGVHWRHLLPIGHLTYFTHQTLRRLMRQHGFKILKMGGGSTIDVSLVKEVRNYLIEFAKTIVLRSLILGVYKPLTKWFPKIVHWQLKLKSNTLNHRILMARTGSQVIMNDEIVAIALREK